MSLFNYKIMLSSTQGERIPEYFAGTDSSDATAFPTWGGALAGAMEMLLLSDED